MTFPFRITKYAIEVGYIRDTWRTPEEAIEKTPYLRSWDKHALLRWKEYGYRPLPSAIYPSRTDGVTLATTKHQETMTYTYINPRKPFVVKFPGEEHSTEQEGTNPERQMHRTEPVVASKLVAHLRPRVLFLSGARSPLYKDGTHSRAAKKTGTGYGWGREGAVHVIIEKAGHSSVGKGWGYCGSHGEMDFPGDGTME